MKAEIRMETEGGIQTERRDGDREEYRQSEGDRER